MDGNFLRLAFAWLASGCAGIGAYVVGTGALNHDGCKAYDSFQEVGAIVFAAFMFSTSLGLFCRALDVIAHEQSDARIREFLRYRR
ncbi:MAG: hypothetical protein WAN43_00620 [Rhodomicrobium sp.]